VITKQTGYASSDGVLHATVEEAQEAEMLRVLNQTNGSAGLDPKVLEMLAADLVGTQFEALLDILTTSPRSRPKARKSAGTTSPRRAARKASSPPDKATTEQARDGFKAMREAVDNPPDATV
jgi:hypothetical protein